MQQTIEATQPDMGIVPTTPITLTLDAASALYVLDALQERSVKAWENARKCVPGTVEHEMCVTAARILDNVHRRLDSLVFPLCRWTSERDCMEPIAGHDGRGVAYCRTHLDASLRIAAAIESVGLPW